MKKIAPIIIQKKSTQNNSFLTRVTVALIVEVVLITFFSKKIHTGYGTKCCFLGLLMLFGIIVV